MKKRGFLLIVGLLFILTACSRTTLSSVHEGMVFGQQRHTSLARDGSYLTLTVTRSCSRGDDSVLCNASHALDYILGELGFEDAVRRRMVETRALDGRQTAENDNFRASWTFHPDDGLQILFENN